jgi:hypothetical protein
MDVLVMGNHILEKKSAAALGEEDTESLAKRAK